MLGMISLVSVKRFLFRIQSLHQQSNPLFTQCIVYTVYCLHMQCIALSTIASRIYTSPLVCPLFIFLFRRQAAPRFASL